MMMFGGAEGRVSLHVLDADDVRAVMLGEAPSDGRARSSGEGEGDEIVGLAVRCARAALLDDPEAILRLFEQDLPLDEDGQARGTEELLRFEVWKWCSFLVDEADGYMDLMVEASSPWGVGEILTGYHRLGQGVTATDANEQEGGRDVAPRVHPSVVVMPPAPFQRENDPSKEIHPAARDAAIRAIASLVESDAAKIEDLFGDGSNTQSVLGQHVAKWLSGINANVADANGHDRDELWSRWRTECRAQRRREPADGEEEDDDDDDDGWLMRRCDDVIPPPRRGGAQVKPKGASETTAPTSHCCYFYTPRGGSKSQGAGLRG